jgi:hypothetical protein
MRGVLYRRGDPTKRDGRVGVPRVTWPQASFAAAILAVVALAHAIAYPVSVSGAKSSPPAFDFGDAPDRQSAVPGNFPSLKRSAGPRFESSDLHLGREADLERDSDQVNLDIGDDGVELQHEPCQEVTYKFLVDASDLPRRAREGPAFLNLFVDWNIDGDWKDVDRRCGNTKRTEVPEHRIQNERINLESFRRKPVQVVRVKAVAGGTAGAENGLVAGTEFWYRGVVSTKQMKAPGDGSDARPQELGEVEDYGPDASEETDFGDACFPLALQVFSCGYPSLSFEGGPRHFGRGLIVLGTLATPESEAQVPDQDFDEAPSSGFAVFDSFFDGTPPSSASSCGEVDIAWSVNVETLKQSRRTADKALLRRIREGRSRVFLNAWVDFENDGAWNVSDCPPARKDGHFSYIKRGHIGLSDAEQRELVEKGEILIVDRVPAGPIPEGGIGCARGTVSVDQDYPDVAGPSNRGASSDGSVIGFYRFGETEDYCPSDDGGSTTPPPPPPPDDPPPPPPDDPPPATPKCSDGADNDSDGKIDGADPGCLTGPGGAYDPDDHGEDDVSVGENCPGPMSSRMITIEQNNVGTEMIGHLLRLNGQIRVQKAAGQADFDTGTLMTTMVCSGNAVTLVIDWTRTGTTITYELFITNDNATGGGTFQIVAAANTR